MSPFHFGKKLLSLFGQIAFSIDKIVFPTSEVKKPLIG